MDTNALGIMEAFPIAHTRLRGRGQGLGKGLQAPCPAVKAEGGSPRGRPRSRLRACTRKTRPSSRSNKRSRRNSRGYTGRPWGRAPGQGGPRKSGRSELFLVPGTMGILTSIPVLTLIARVGWCPGACCIFTNKCVFLKTNNDNNHAVVPNGLT